MEAKEIVWTEKAQRKYRNVLSYLNENWNPKTIIKFKKSVKKTLNMLSNNPYIGRADEKYKRTKKIYMGNNIYMHYMITKEHILIITLWDARQDSDNLIL